MKLKDLHQETLYTETITRLILGHRPESNEYSTSAERKVTCSIAGQREEEFFERTIIGIMILI